MIAFKQRVPNVSNTLEMSWSSNLLARQFSLFSISEIDATSVMDSVEDSDAVEDEVCYPFFFYCDIKTFMPQHILLKGQKETH